MLKSGAAHFWLPTVIPRYNVDLAMSMMHVLRRIFRSRQFELYQTISPILWI